MPDAFLFSSVLDSAGIECYLADENTIRMDWFWSNLLGGIKLCVRKTDAGEASSLLEQGVPEKFDVEGVEEYQQPPLSRVPVPRYLFSGTEQRSGLRQCLSERALAAASQSLGVRCVWSPVARVHRETAEQLADSSIVRPPDSNGDRKLSWCVDSGDPIHPRC
jgi:hypothetical protein